MACQTISKAILYPTRLALFSCQYKIFGLIQVSIEAAFTAEEYANRPDRQFLIDQIFIDIKKDTPIHSNRLYSESTLTAH